MKLHRLLRSSGQGSRRGKESCNASPEKQEEAAKGVQKKDKGKPEHRKTTTVKTHRLRDALRRCWVARSGSTRIRVPATTERDNLPWGFTIDADEWRVVQGNFTGPVGQWYEPDDMDKPDVYGWRRVTAEGLTVGIMPVPPYRPEPPDGGNDETSSSSSSRRPQPPSYEWARLACLPTPVMVDDSWSSLHAAQREKGRLFETQAYLASRIAEIDTQVRAVMDAKLEWDPMTPQRYCAAQMAGVLDAAGLDDPRQRLCRELETGQRRDFSGYEWVADPDKVIVLRERISPLSLLSPRPGY